MEANWTEAEIQRLVLAAEAVLDSCDWSRVKTGPLDNYISHTAAGAAELKRILGLLPARPAEIRSIEPEILEQLREASEEFVRSFSGEMASFYLEDKVTAAVQDLVSALDQEPARPVLSSAQAAAPLVRSGRPSSLVGPSRRTPPETSAETVADLQAVEPSA